MAPQNVTGQGLSAGRFLHTFLGMIIAFSGANQLDVVAFASEVSRSGRARKPVVNGLTVAWKSRVDFNAAAKLHGVEQPGNTGYTALLSSWANCLAR